jgi:hypothetical protein
MDKEKEEMIYKVTQTLPMNPQKCMAYGYATYCCAEDMDEKPDWHEVTFKIVIRSYKLKNYIPEDIEESILESYRISESWCVDSNGMHLIGVTKWKKFHG